MDLGAGPGLNFDFATFSVQVPTAGSFASAAKATEPPPRATASPTRNNHRIVFIVPYPLVTCSTRKGSAISCTLFVSANDCTWPISKPWCSAGPLRVAIRSEGLWHAIRAHRTPLGVVSSDRARQDQTDTPELL